MLCRPIPIRPVLTPVTTSNDHYGRRSRTSEPACGTAGERGSTSDGRDCAAPASARGPLKAAATTRRILQFNKMEGFSIGRGAYLMIPEKRISR